MNQLLFFVAQAASPADCASAMLLPVGMIVLMYLLLIRPQQKQAKEQQEFQDGLKVGDEVVTAGGIYGKVAGLDGSVVTLEVASRTKVRFARSQVVQRASSLKEEADADSDSGKSGSDARS